MNKLLIVLIAEKVRFLKSIKVNISDYVTSTLKFQLSACLRLSYLK